MKRYTVYHRAVDKTNTPITTISLQARSRKEALDRVAVATGIPRAKLRAEFSGNRQA